MNNIIGKRINEALAESNIKQKELAHKIGVKDNVVSYWCNGSRIPNTEQIVKIAKALSVSTDYLLGISNVATNDKDLQFVCDYTGLDEETVEELHKRSQRASSIHLFSSYNTSNLCNFINVYINVFEDYIDLISDNTQRQNDFIESHKELVNTTLEKYNIFIKRNNLEIENDYKNCIDEFENIEEYKQYILNELIEDIAEDWDDASENNIYLNSYIYKLQNAFLDLLDDITGCKSSEKAFTESLLIDRKVSNLILFDRGNK